MFEAFDFFQMLREPYPRGIIKYRSPITPLVMIPLKEKCQRSRVLEGSTVWLASSIILLLSMRVESLHFQDVEALGDS